ncbi:MAG: YgiQ family radical SAM protein [Oscillospiraceae bacterium]
MNELKPEFLPVSMKEVHARGWDGVDFVCVTGDAYVDHPSFGVVIIARLLERLGYRVAMMPQPTLSNPNAFCVFGKPRLAFLITGGCIDSMVSNYTVAKRVRNGDAYSPADGKTRRPDRAATLYSRAAKAAYPDCPVILGGIEASLRRFAHYDYWSNSVMPSILIDSGADLISYGMGEKQAEILARRLADGEPISSITDVRGTVCFASVERLPTGTVSCASFEKVVVDRETFARAFRQQLDEQDAVRGHAVVQKHGDRLVLQNTPMPSLTREELDDVFALPFMRAAHPMYETRGGVKAIEEIEFSVMHNRGCFGHCNFCSIAVHQGRQVVSRSMESIVTEVEAMTKSPRFKGYVHDVGGPTANFRYPSCTKQLTQGLCADRKCLGTSPCKALEVDHTEYLELLRRLRLVPGVKKVFVRSGLRFDYLMLDRKEDFLRELVEHHVSGQLKVAPEHCSARVLEKMGKPPIEVYERFAKRFYALTKEAGKEQYLVPYLMSSHPGSTLRDAVELALFLKKNRMRPEQVQDFYPTPGTISTCMFYTGIDPLNMKPIYVPRTDAEKWKQRALLQYFKQENRRAVIEALVEAGRADLIGSGPECLVTSDQQYRKELQETSCTSMMKPNERAVSRSPATNTSPVRDTAEGGRPLSARRGKSKGRPTNPPQRRKPR